MERQDADRFKACLLGASELYGKTFSKPVLDLWWGALERFPIQAVEAGFARHIQNPDAGQYMPKPADIIRCIEGTTADSAQVAWAAVDRAVRTVGPYASVTFDDAITMRVLQDMGGWIALGTRTEDDWPFVANEFRARYAGYRGRGGVSAHPPRLPGITEAENARAGHDRADHVLVGDQERAREVIRLGSGAPSVPTTRIGEAASAVPALRLVRAPDKEASA